MHHQVVSAVDIKQNYFELFELPLQFKLDAEQLEQRYQSLLRETHPDRVSAGDEHSRRLVLQAASYVNSAYATLRDPLQRAIYMLQIDGVDPAARGSELPRDFLIEQISLRERVEDAPDASSLQILIDDLNAKIKLLYRQLAEQLRIGCHDKAVIAVNKLQFYRKILEQADDALFDRHQDRQA